MSMTSESLEPIPAKGGKVKRRRFMTFGLRSLFALTTICAVGVNLWLRPYRVEHEQMGPKVVGSVRRVVRSGDPDPLANPYRREVRTMRRAFPAKPVRDGKTQIYDRQANLILEENWLDDALYGPYSGWDTDGTLIEQGVNGNAKIDGRWITEHWEGRPPRLRDETEYRNGLPAGTWKHFRHGMLVLEKEFQDGVLLHEAKFEHDQQGKVVRVVERRWNEDHTRAEETVWLGNRDRKSQETALVTVSSPGSRVISRFDHVSGKVLYQYPYWEHDNKDGAARGWHENETLRYQGAWHERLPDGPWKYWSADGRLLRELDFERGALVRSDGRTVDDFTARFRFFRPHRFNDLVSIDFEDVPLREVVAWLREQMPGVEVGVRQEALDSQVRCSLKAHDMPLRAAICLLLEPHGLIAVDRYEKLWLTTRDDAWARREPTGVEALEPGRQSRVAQGLDAPTVLVVNGFSLTNAADYLADLHGCSIRLDDELEQAIKDGYRPVFTANIRDRSLRSALGEILHKLDLACELRGDAIYICRPKKESAKIPSSDD